MWKCSVVVHCCKESAEVDVACGRAVLVYRCEESVCVPCVMY